MTDKDTTRLGPTDALLVATCLLVAAGGYFLVKEIPAAAPLMVDKPLLGVVVYVIVCVVVLGALIRWSRRHLAMVRTMGLAGPLALFSASMPAIGGFLLIAFIDVIGQWLRDMGAPGAALYAGAFILLAGCALLPTYAQAALGGWAFGLALGFPAAMVGVTGAALIGYFLGSRAAGDRVVELIKQNPKWEAVREALMGGGFFKTLGLVTLLRLPINSPFAVTNLVMSSVRLPLTPYILGTIIGLAPRTGVVVYLGSEVQGALADGGLDKPRWLVFGSIALFVGVVLVIGYIANKAIERVTSEGGE